MATVTSYTSDAIDAKLALKANKDGNETLTGTKTFSSFPVLPAATPSLAQHAATKGYVDSAVSASQGYVVVNDVSEIPEGATPGQVFLVVNAPNIGTLPEIFDVIATSTSEAGNNLNAELPLSLEPGDVLVAFLHAQTSTDGPWSTPSGWSADFTSTVNSDYRITAIRSFVVTDPEEVPSAVNFVLTGTTGQRRSAVVLQIRGASEIEPVIAGTPVGLNGVGTDDSNVPSVVNPAPMGLHLVFGWSNGNVASGNYPSAPTPTGGMNMVGSCVEPPTPTGGFSTTYIFSRDLYNSGPSGSISLDWPHLSQRGGIAVVIPSKE